MSVEVSILRMSKYWRGVGSRVQYLVAFKGPLFLEMPMWPRQAVHEGVSTLWGGF